RLGFAHEKGNYLQFKKNKTEDGSRPSKALCAMDLWNNKEGIKIGKANKNASKAMIEQKVIEAIKNGTLRIVKMDENSRFLDCDGNIISIEALKEWDPPKCLIKSNGF
ncbi:MAG: hypothetical protein H0X62_03785, partial [Bacteroidetes bacterium]|nr:hypothetical protein [Bacteroidota bacterium]